MDGSFVAIDAWESSETRSSDEEKGRGQRGYGTVDVASKRRAYAGCKKGENVLATNFSASYQQYEDCCTKESIVETQRIQGVFYP